MLCTPPKHSPPSKAPTAAPSWWSWTSSKAGVGTNGAEAVSAKSNTNLFENKIVLARRGECMFEDKALIAATHGARGIIIYNNEDNLFIMAGKKDGIAASSSKKGVDNVLSQFPAVMLGHSEAQHLISMMNWLRQRNMEPVYERSVVAIPMSLDLVSLGHTEYPKLHTKEQVIAVYSEEPWGIVVTNAATHGQEWQLFILKRGDMGQLTPWQIKSASGYDMCCTGKLSHNPVEVYARTLSRKCPSFVNVDFERNNALSIKKRSKRIKVP